MPRQLLSAYPRDLLRYDEAFAAWAQPREHCSPLMSHLAGLSAEQMTRRFEEVDRRIRENGVTYNVYDAAEGAERPWALDPLPMILPADEWAQIEAAVVQRATLFNRILADVYSNQYLLHSGALPPALVFGHPGFLRPAVGMKVPQQQYLHIYAADLARSPDGQWWVLADRTQAPSGMGYALENRYIVSRLFADLFREQRVQHISGFYRTLRDSLVQFSPDHDGSPLVVLLTPWPYNETYFEHAFLARQLGFPLVEGQDLLVRDGCVWLKTLGGLTRVHGILRRMDDDFCDPLELRADSALGIPGLLDSARQGKVLIANALGSGLVESGALLGYLPGLCEQLLGEPLKMPSIATWWCGEPAALESVTEQFDQLVIKPAWPGMRMAPQFVADLTAGKKAELLQDLHSHPAHYIAQELVQLSRTPVWDREQERRLVARAMGLRVYAVATPQGFQVLPGGLARTASRLNARMISSQQGGGSKDVWVLGEGGVQQELQLLRSTITAADLVRMGPNLSSRVVENLFWFGRYAERCDAHARLLRIALGRELDDARQPDGREWPAIERFCQQLGLLGHDAAATPPVDNLQTRADDLLNAIFSTQHWGSLASNLRQLARVGFLLKERLSTDNWRTINTLIHVLQRQDSDGSEDPGLFEALSRLDDVISHLMALTGFCYDGMTRDFGWRFLMLGIRIERIQYACQALLQGMQDGHQRTGLDWLLEVFDSIVTYRARYMARPEWLPVLDLLIRDPSNPRSLEFQARKLVFDLNRLSEALGDVGQAPLEQCLASIRNLPVETLSPDDPRLHQQLNTLNQACFTLSDRLGLRFFSHVTPVAQAAV